MVRQGRIAVNGKLVTELPILVDAEKDKIEVDGEKVRFLKGPKISRAGVRSDEQAARRLYNQCIAGSRKTRAIDLLPPDFGARVYPVGRLDSESKGLLLLTNDGDLTNRLTHPRYGVPKTYRSCH